jgi:hypothetical protein
MMVIGLPPDFKEFLALLNGRRVDCLVRRNKIASASPKRSGRPATVSLMIAFIL